MILHDLNIYVSTYLHIRKNFTILLIYYYFLTVNLFICIYRKELHLLFDLNLFKALASFKCDGKLNFSNKIPLFKTGS